MEELERLLHWLSSSLDTRVYVAVTRGLWDLTSKDVLEYAEDLQEGGGGQRVRPGAGGRGEGGDGKGIFTGVGVCSALPR